MSWVWKTMDNCIVNWPRLRCRLGALSGPLWGWSVVVSMQRGWAEACGLLISQKNAWGKVWSLYSCALSQVSAILGITPLLYAERTEVVGVKLMKLLPLERNLRSKWHLCPSHSLCLWLSTSVLLAVCTIHAFVGGLSWVLQDAYLAASLAPAH